MRHAEDSYYSVNEALEILSISRANLYVKLNNDELLSKKVDKKRFVYIDDEVRETHKSKRQSKRQSERQGNETVEQRLLSEIDYLRQQNYQLQNELFGMRKSAEEISKRHDTIVMKLSTMNHDQQLQIEQLKSKNFLQKIAELFSFN